MYNKRINKDNQDKKNVKFSLIEVIVIMMITSIVSITITIVVSFSINNKSNKVKIEKEISEFMNTYDTIIKEYYKEINKEELITSAIDGMLDYLNDPYTIYYNKEETDTFKKTLEGEYEGLGIEILLSNDNKVIINNVYENSSAGRAGIKSKDEILLINDKPVTNKKLSQISDEIKNSKDKNIKIKILRNNKEMDFEVKLSKVEIPSVTYEIKKQSNKSIAIIKISTFANNTSKQFKEAYEKINNEKIDGMIIDLRNNTGGYLSSCKSIIEMFLDKNQVMYQLQIKDTITKYKNENSKIIDKKVVVLVNGQSASASEVLTAALNENLNTEIIGTKTYGKGKVQKSKTLSNGTMIKYTAESWLTPKGNQIDEKGIEPTIKIELDKKYYTNPIYANDNQLKKALEVICKD